jgi:hypothetical protein
MLPVFLNSIHPWLESRRQSTRQWRLRKWTWNSAAIPSESVWSFQQVHQGSAIKDNFSFENFVINQHIFKELPGVRKDGLSGNLLNWGSKPYLLDSDSVDFLTRIKQAKFTRRSNSC